MVGDASKHTRLWTLIRSVVFTSTRIVEFHQVAINAIQDLNLQDVTLSMSST